MCPARSLWPPEFRSAQTGIARGQRGWKWQPGGGRIGLGNIAFEHDPPALDRRIRDRQPPTAAPA